MAWCRNGSGDCFVGSSAWIGRAFMVCRTGVSCWRMDLAAQTGAALRVVELFAVLHDVKRKHDGQDPEHGLRAADFADWLHRRSQIELSKSEIAAAARSPVRA